MTFKGAFQSFQTVETHLGAGEPDLPHLLLLHLHPSLWGTTLGSSGAPHHREFTVCGHCFPLIPWKSLDLPVLLGCPFQGKIFSCGHGQAAWGLVFAGIMCSESSICYPHPLFFHLEESPGRGEAERVVTGTVPAVQSCWGHPALAQGGDSQCFQFLRVPSGPILALGTCGTCGICALGMLQLPCPTPGPAECWQRRLPVLGAVLRLLMVIPLPAQPSLGLSFPPQLGLEQPRALGMPAQPSPGSVSPGSCSWSSPGFQDFSWC